MQTIKYVKQPVAVVVTVSRDGQVRPKKFQWKDGHTYTIDRVTKIERYTVMVEGLPRFLYDEEGKWFMEDEVLIEVTE